MTAAPCAIETHHLSKSYGPVRALDGLSLSIERGEAFGFLGPNGSGKTTTIRLLLDLVRPDAGQARILGHDCQRDGVAARRLVAYLPGELPDWGGMRGGEVVAYLAALRGGVDQRWIQELALRFDLDLSRRYREYSKGNKQKVGVVQAFANRRPILILDEPTSGLDPLHQQTFYALVRQARDEWGATVFMSSHVFGDVEHVCDRIGILRAGQLVRVARLDEVRSERARSLVVHFARPVPVAALEALDGAVAKLGADARTASVSVRGELGPVLAALARLPVIDIETLDVTLEEAFLRYYQ